MTAVPTWAWVVIACAVAFRLTAMAIYALQHADRQIRSIVAEEVGPADLTRDALGSYVDDWRIHAIHGNIVVLVDGQMLARSSSRGLWRRYLPPDGREDDGPRRQWPHIASALQEVLGDAQPQPGRNVVSVAGGRR